MFNENVTQEEVTQWQIDGGIQKYRRLKEQNKTTGINSHSGMSLMKLVLAPTSNQVKKTEDNLSLEEGIAKYLKESKKPWGQGSTSLPVARLLKARIKPSTLAFLTVRAVLDRLLTDKLGVTGTAIFIGNCVYEECQYRNLKDRKDTTYKDLRTEVEAQVMLATKRKVANDILRRNGQIPLWDKKDMLFVGALLIDLMQEYTGLITKEAKSVGRNKFQAILALSDEATKYGKDLEELYENMFPLLVPMVEKPHEWTTPFDGGYPAELGWKRSLIKNKKRAYLERQTIDKMPTVYAAINAVQNTAWRVNREVYDVLAHLWNENRALPVFEDLVELPSLPWKDAVDKNEEPEEYRKMRNLYSERRDFNRSAKSKTLRVGKVLSIAKQFYNITQCYYPHQCDFRGRFYPLAHYLTPQGNDLSKSLLKFSEAKAVGEEGAGWLAIHGANCFGKDKASLDDRVFWTEYHTPSIQAVAEDPYSNRWWMEAEEPFQFLAFCFEWAGYMREGESYKSSIPCGVDGSCNGLQHYAALQRDEIGGRAVNLINGAKPADAYAVVQAKMLEINLRNTSSPDEWTNKIANYLAEHEVIDRKLVKRPTMTLVYGATKYGHGQQMLEELRKRTAKTKLDILLGDSGWKRTKKYLADIIREALTEVASGAVETQNFLTDLAKAARQANVVLTWHVASGLEIEQAYPKRHVKVLSSMSPFNGRVSYTITEEDRRTAFIDHRKCISAISPNYIHSHDASHMMLTVEKCSEQGVTGFHAIHDSFGTHAADMPTLNSALRECFIVNHRDNHLEKLREMTLNSVEKSKLISEFPSLPKPGNLNLEDVLESSYFFA